MCLFSLDAQEDEVSNQNNSDDLSRLAKPDVGSTLGPVIWVLGGYFRGDLALHIQIILNLRVQGNIKIDSSLGNVLERNSFLIKEN